MNRAQLISAFPGTGKTWFYLDNIYRSDQIILDSDSSKFSKEDFPANYIENIKGNMYMTSIILISSHKEVRDALVNEGLYFTLVYPDISLKEEYIKRYEDRGSDPMFIKLLDKNWNTWITELMSQEGCEHVVLQSGKYINDIIV